MVIYNEQMQPLETYDPTQGYVEIRTRIEHHDAVAEVSEQSHYEVIAEYPSGGKDVRKVVDVPCVPGQEAWDETIEYGVYIPYTEEELEQMNRPSMEDRLESVEAAINILLSGVSE